MKAVVIEMRKTRKPIHEQRAEQITSASHKISPCAYQTEANISDYYRNAKAGDVAVVRQTQHHLLIYSVTEIENINTPRGRIYIKQFGAFYVKSGKNCFHPKGQTTLVAPTEDILKWASEHPRGEFDYRTFPLDEPAIGQ